MKRILLSTLGILTAFGLRAQTAHIQADKAVLDAPFGPQDEQNFAAPPKDFWPETWFHFIGDNVSREGMDADLEAIAAAKIAGIQWFHGAFGGRWPQVEEPIIPLSEDWDRMVAYLGKKARSLNLRLTIQTCPGWAMAGGPWVQPQDAMRDLIWSRTDVKGGATDIVLPKGRPSEEDWRDYRDICVLAFPTPEGDTGAPLQLKEIKADAAWTALLKGEKGVSEPAPGTHIVSFRADAPLRSLEMPAVQELSHAFCNTPGVTIDLQAFCKDGVQREAAHVELPMSSWQDNEPFVLALREIPDVLEYRLTLSNEHPMNLSWLRFYSASRHNDWRAAAGRTLRSREKYQETALQAPESYVDTGRIMDLTHLMDPDGRLRWTAPEGQWTILRYGHVNIGYKNGPAPANATGWECNKLDSRGARVQFTNYVGRLADGPLQGKADGMLMDSWECRNQNWTGEMEAEFRSRAGYGLRQWMPALSGYVLDSPSATAQFLGEWRRVKTALYNQNFFGEMVRLAHGKGLDVQYETAGGDIVAMDYMEYYKYADVPMTEFWHPLSEGYVGDLNFKPVKPTASAAHLYGKRRVAAESFTSFDLSWDEHWEMLKEVANLNMTEGVTHNVFHTYTHNPQVGFLPPGTSFGSRIGTPFLRGQTWWKYMPHFTQYLSRTSYLLERGLPVVDVLWYTGDEVGYQKPDQRFPFPKGYKYDYCNPDALFGHLRVKDGKLTTEDGISYGLLWIPENERLRPETVEKVHEFIAAGVKVLMGPTITTGSLQAFGLEPNLLCEEDILWAHRKADGAEWYYITAPTGKDFHGTVKLRAKGKAEIWDAVSGTVAGLESTQEGDYQLVHLDLERAGNCFVVFRPESTKAPVQALPTTKEKPLNTWTLTFPEGWGAPEKPLKIKALKPWKDLPLGEEGKAFSGTAVYETTFTLPRAGEFILDLGRVDMIADISLNGTPQGVLWASPYKLTLRGKAGRNTLRIAVTGTWFNRLAYDASLPEARRKTWTIEGPKAGSPLRESGLIGPVRILF